MKGYISSAAKQMVNITRRYVNSTGTRQFKKVKGTVKGSVRRAVASRGKTSGKVVKPHFQKRKRSSS